jgi:hypothetical protein
VFRRTQKSTVRGVAQSLRISHEGAIRLEHAAMESMLYDPAIANKSPGVSIHWVP